MAKLRQIWDKFRKYDSVFTYHNWTNYKINKWIFRGGFLVILIYLFVILYINDFNFSKFYVYSYCPPSAMKPCINAIYDSDYCNPLCGKPLYQTFGQMPNDAIRQYGKDMTNKRCYEPACTVLLMYHEDIIGTKPPNYIKFFSLIVINIIIVCFLINHLFLNWHFFRDNQSLVKDEILEKMNKGGI
jgi:hypothetical protein